jgi:pyrimidine-nucleoside phosphorylase
MNFIDIITQKKLGRALTPEMIRAFVQGAADKSVPDYQLTALLMAIRLQGMTPEETTQLTLAMRDSGDVADLSAIPGVKVDKHSTGGVGDTTTLVLAPLVAACGVPVAKMSGRGLGHTGGTLDKLESIPGFRVGLSEEAFVQQVRDIGLAVIGQTGALAPADKTLYALRDVTSTVDSLPLIASSIMSKKLAAGSKNIVLDVKVGSGAFMKDAEQGRKLAETMVGIGKACSRRVSAVISNMDVPLGSSVGNALEVLEAVEILKGNGDGALRALCVELAAQMVSLSFGRPIDECRIAAEQVVCDGSALDKFREWIGAQGGDTAFIDDPASLCPAKIEYAFSAPRSGFIGTVNAAEVGKASMLLGAGREVVGDSIDPSAGIRLLKKPGDPVTAGETLAILYTSDVSRIPAATEHLLASVVIGDEPPGAERLIIDIVS